MHWLSKVSIAVLNAHLAMLPRLTAEESLLQVRVSQIGAGLTSEESGRSTLSDWENQAQGLTPTKATRPKATLKEAAGMGVRVVRVPRTTTSVTT